MILKRGDKAWDRFWSKVSKGPGCWEWNSAKLASGYGLFSIDGKRHYGHRLVYSMRSSTIPKGMYVCHSCDNPSCVRPSHLFLGTPAQNQQDSKNKNRLNRAFGVRSGRSKLSEFDIKRIRSDTRSHIRISKDYPVERSTISYIKRGETWKHVT